MRRIPALTFLLVIVSVAASGQDSNVWRTAADIRENAIGSVVGKVVDVEGARNRLRLQLDNDPYQPVTVLTDSVSTQYYGFGGIINGSPEIFRGSSGFANVRIGDRLDVHGQGRTGATIAAGQVTLIGRDVQAGTVGVGTTRPGTSVSTPTATSTVTTDDARSAGYAEGTVRQINLADGRLVIQTPQRRMITVNTPRNTPVYYRGELYRVANLEEGDVIRVEPEPRSAQADEITARSIEVTRSVQDVVEEEDRPADQRLTSISGRVESIDRSSDMVTIDTGRNEVRVDMLRAIDAESRRMRAGDLRAGDEVTIIGSYAANSDIFLASTVRMGAPESGTEIVVEEEDDDEDQELGEFVTFTFSGVVSESLQTSPTLVVRDRASGRTVRVFVTNDFVVQTRSGGYALASSIRNGDGVLIKAYRDEDENLIAQTIRLR